MVEHIRRERHILDSLSYPGIVQLFFTFQVCAAVVNGSLQQSRRKLAA